MISRPSENAGTWRGPFEPSTVAFGAERKRVCVDYAILYNFNNLEQVSQMPMVLLLFYCRFYCCSFITDVIAADPPSLKSNVHSSDFT